MKPDRKKTKPSHDLHPPARSRAEDSEPTVAHGPVPVWVFVVLGLVLFWGMVYLDNHAGGFNPQVYGFQFASTNELAKAQPEDPAMKAFLAGQGVYNQTCFSCHQANGLGTPGMFPPLDGSEWVTSDNPGRLVRIILDGLSGPITVKGQEWPGTTVMPGFRGTGPSDEDLANVATYVRGAWSNRAAPVTAEMVTAIREETSGHAGRSWTGAELEQVPVD